MGPNSLLSIEEKRKAFGAELASKRVSKGFEREDIAYTTRISLNFVVALEEGRFNELPGVVFGRGFVRNIARYLELDSKELIFAYDACWSAEDQVSLKDIPIGTRPLKPVRLDFSEISHQLKALKSHISKKSTFIATTLVVALAAVLLSAKLFKVQSFKKIFSEKMKISTVEKKVEENVNEIVSNASPVIFDEDVDQAYLSYLAADTNLISLTSAVDQGAMEVSYEQKNEEISLPNFPKNREKEPVITFKKDVQKTNASTSQVTVDVKIDKSTQEVKKLTLKVRYPVVIRVSLDNKQGTTETYRPRNYEFSFAKDAQLIIFDASAVEVFLDDKIIRSFGDKGSIQRLSLQTKKDSPTKNL